LICLIAERFADTVEYNNGIVDRIAATLRSSCGFFYVRSGSPK
jgi:hypothetical protein